MKKINLVTGAAGFLGSTLVRELLEKKESIRAFILNGDPAEKYVPEGVEKVYGDLCDKESLRKMFEGLEGYEVYVYHIASIVTVNPDYSKKVMDVNVGGTDNIIDLCLEYGVKKLVYCSSTGAIPETPKGTKISETKDFDENKVLGCYSQSKAIATKHVLDAVKERGLNACVIHPSGIMGPQDQAMGETTKVFIQIINGEMKAGIAGSFNLADVRDLADGAVRAMEYGRCGECYILGNEEVSFKEMAAIIHQECGCKKMRFFLPLGMADALAKGMEKKAKKKGTRPLMTTFSVYNLARNNDFDCTKAKRELGYKTRSFRETLSDEICWLKSEGKIKASLKA